jgi:hypothetical protein
MKLLKWSSSCFLAILLAACASSPTIRSDYDHTANFTGYRTFGYISPLGTDVRGYSTLITQRLKAATQRELESRGYQYSDAHPDLLINFSARLADKVRVSETPAPIGYYGYRRAAYYGTWNAYAYETWVDQYKEGTLNIDIVDGSRQQLVWEGVAIGRVADEDLANPEPAISRAVAEIFAKYPFRAGGG